MKNRCLSIVFFFVSLFLFTIMGTQSINAMEMAIETEGRFKSWMGMDALSPYSAQYHYLENNTYDENNLRVTHDGYYAVAMGSYYGELGDKFFITFESGATVPVVKVDEKADAHTIGGRGMSMASDLSIIEPIITTSSFEYASRPDLLDLLYYHGNAGMVYSQFASTESIVGIRKVTGTPPVQQVEVQAEEEVVVEEEIPKDEPLTGETSSLTIANKEQDNVVMYFPKVMHDKLVFLDTEFSESRDLVQAAFIVYQRIDDKDLFFLTSSLNVYVNAKVTPEFEKFTGITKGFLGNEGVTKSKAEEIINGFIDDNSLNSCNALLIGHGVNQDLEILYQSGCELSADVFDTLEEAKVLLDKERQLKLSDLLLDAGIVQENVHDAYQDARNLVPVFNHLVWVDFNNKIRKEERY